jgi:hypothetical protein
VALLATIHKVLHEPINLPRELNLHQPITLGNVLYLGGAAVFVLAIAWIPLEDSFSSPSSAAAANAAYKVGVACGFFRFASWLITAGWIMRRWEEGQWPFNRPTLTRIVKNK